MSIDRCTFDIALGRVEEIHVTLCFCEAHLGPTVVTVWLLGACVAVPSNVTQYCLLAPDHIDTSNLYSHIMCS